MRSITLLPTIDNRPAFSSFIFWFCADPVITLFSPQKSILLSLWRQRIRWEFDEKWDQMQDNRSPERGKQVKTELVRRVVLHWWYTSDIRGEKQAASLKAVHSQSAVNTSYLQSLLVVQMWPPHGHRPRNSHWFLSEMMRKAPPLSFCLPQVNSPAQPSCPHSASLLFTPAGLALLPQLHPYSAVLHEPPPTLHPPTGLSAYIQQGTVTPKLAEYFSPCLFSHPKYFSLLMYRTYWHEDLRELPVLIPITDHFACGSFTFGYLSGGKRQGMSETKRADNKKYMKTLSERDDWDEIIGQLA